MTKFASSVYHKVTNLDSNNIAGRFSPLTCPGASEADWPLPQAQHQPRVPGPEVPDRAPGQAPLPQDYQ